MRFSIYYDQCTRSDPCVTCRGGLVDLTGGKQRNLMTESGGRVSYVGRVRGGNGGRMGYKEEYEGSRGITAMVVEPGSSSLDGVNHHVWCVPRSELTGFDSLIVKAKLLMRVVSPTFAVIRRNRSSKSYSGTQYRSTLEALQYNSTDLLERCSYTAATSTTLWHSGGYMLLINNVMK
ncbi:hypothetical protein RRG08_058703 [Elysia crispata]|uniref:Uncharacterized protein n=1 Tax=Elysia crispata TaxID=231223 RepID=A0AAE0YWK1_9GAST|nr:hypothetical protein RRG08_058703 [Elysia crispata]